MSQCYVCLEPCDEKSPCECGMIVHKECLYTTCQKIRTKDCTVCKSPIKIEYIDINIDPPDILEMHEAITIYENSGCALLCVIFGIFSIYICLGLVGKLILFLLGHQTNFWCFWCMDHLISSIGVLSVIILMTKLFPVPREDWQRETPDENISI